MSEDRMITVEEAAKELGITLTSVYDAIKRNRISATRFGKRAYAVSYNSVMEYKKNRRGGGKKRKAE